MLDRTHLFKFVIHMDHSPQSRSLCGFRGLESLLPASTENTVNIADEECWVSLGRGSEVLLYPQMNLHRIAFEPTGAARGELRRFQVRSRS